MHQKIRKVDLLLAAVGLGDFLDRTEAHLVLVDAIVVDIARS